MTTTAQASQPTRIVLAFGTRPEWLKLHPVMQALRARAPGDAQFWSLFTGQQAELVRPLLAGFDELPDVDLGDLPRQESLTSMLAARLPSIEAALTELRPDWVVVQGDTLSTFAVALAAFYLQIPIAHVEAGLRTYDLDSPFPEEMHRRLVTIAAAVHFCPTLHAREHLLREGVPSERIVVTGNTSIDLLRLALEQGACEPPAATGVARAARLLVTVHRRENLARLASDLIPALLALLDELPEARLDWVLHPGRAEAIAREALAARPRVRLLEPMQYPEFLRLLAEVDVVFTDSGGVSEECTELGVPTLVLREATERVESLESGNARLVGTRREDVLRSSRAVLGDLKALARMRERSDAYGDGYAADRIVQHLLTAK